MASAALPVEPVEAWRDAAGTLHPTKDAALQIEVERLIGRVGGAENIAPAIAKMLVDKREQLVPLLEAFGPVLASAEGDAA